MSRLSYKDQAIKDGIKKQSVVDRFNSKLECKDNGCIEYNGFAWDSRDRYRGFHIYPTKQHPKLSKAMVKAHRFSFALHYGFRALPKAPPPGKFKPETKVINHICCNPRCVNPEHLNVLTTTENSTYKGPDNV
jgi:hypothetical protein